MWSRLCLLQTSRTDENLVISGACASVSENSSTDDVLGRRRRPFGLSATRENRNPARAQRRLWRLMASNIRATSQKEDVPEKEAPDTAPDRPLLDLSNAAVKNLIRSPQNPRPLPPAHIHPPFPPHSANSHH